MLNVQELERRWKRYRRSKQIPYLIAGGVTAVVIAGVLYSVFSPEVQQIDPQIESSKRISAAEKITTSQPLARTEAALPQEHLRPVPQQVRPPMQSASTTEQPSLKLSPSMGFMQEFESDVMNYYFNETPSEPSHAAKTESQPKAAPAAAPLAEARPSRQEPLPAIASQSLPAKTVGVPEEIVLSKEEPEPVEQQRPASGQMLIQREKDMKDIQDVITRFKKNKNPVLSLFVAKRYYQIGNYQQAYNYALITNELDSGIEDSWLIFAKSLYKLEQKDMAIKTLKTYIQESSSVKAKITLDQMEKGTFE